MYDGSMTLIEAYDANMLAALPDPSTAMGWAKLLMARIDARKPTLDKYRQYYDGVQPIAYASPKFKTAFGGLFTEFADNFSQLIVDAVEERLNVGGFTIPGQQFDTDAWNIWLRNGMEAEAQVAHTEALTTGTAYAIVWADALGRAQITCESADNVTVFVDRTNRRRRTAACKKWIDEDGYHKLIVYLPDALWKFKSVKPTEYLESQIEWEPWSPANEPWPLPNPLGVVPVVPLVTRPPLVGFYEGRSELQSCLPVQDSINLLVMDMIIAAEFAAFRQRWVTGMEIPVDPVTGDPVEPFSAAVDRLWTAEEPNAKFGEFSATDLSNYVTGIEMLVQHLATQTRTPPHYFFLNGQYPSGDAIKSAETGLVAKVKDRSVFFGSAWGEVMRLCFAVEGDARADENIAVAWGEFEYRSEAELADAAIKMAQLNVPVEALWQRWGASPAQIAEWRTQRAGDTFARMLTPQQ